MVMCDENVVMETIMGAREHGIMGSCYLWWSCRRVLLLLGGILLLQLIEVADTYSDSCLLNVKY